MTNDSQSTGHDKKNTSPSVTPAPDHEPDLFANPPRLMTDETPYDDTPLEPEGPAAADHPSDRPAAEIASPPPVAANPHDISTTPSETEANDSTAEPVAAQTEQADTASPAVTATNESTVESSSSPADANTVLQLSETTIIDPDIGDMDSGHATAVNNGDAANNKLPRQSQHDQGATENASGASAASAVEREITTGTAEPAPTESETLSADTAQPLSPATIGDQETSNQTKAISETGHSASAGRQTEPSHGTDSDSHAAEPVGPALPHANDETRTPASESMVAAVGNDCEETTPQTATDVTANTAHEACPASTVNDKSDSEHTGNDTPETSGAVNIEVKESTEPKIDASIFEDYQPIAIPPETYTSIDEKTTRSPAAVFEATIDTRAFGSHIPPPAAISDTAAPAISNKVSGKPSSQPEALGTDTRKAPTAAPAKTASASPAAGTPKGHEKSTRRSPLASRPAAQVDDHDPISDLPDLKSLIGMQPAAEEAADKPFFYEDGARRQRLDLLMHFCMQWHEILAITSPGRNGKTTFINYLAEHVADSQNHCVITVRHRMTTEAFIKAVYNAVLGTAVGETIEHNTAVTFIRDRLQQQYRRALPPLLIFDDAHNLNPDLLQALKAMVYMTQPQDALGANLIFVGSESMLPLLNKMITTPKVKVLDLPRLTALSARRFIQARLAHAGFNSPESVFSQRQVNKILGQTHYLPGQLDAHLSHRLRNTPEFKKLAGRNHVRWPVKLFLLALPVAAAAFWFQQDVRSYYSQNAERLGALVAMTLPALKEQLGLAPETTAEAAADATPTDGDTTNKPDSAAETSPYDDESLFVQAPKEPQVQPGDDVAPRKNHHLWLTLQDPNKVTLQIYGTTEEAGARRLISQYKLQGKAFYIGTRIQGYPWFSVIYGTYDNVEAAKAHLAEVPEPLRGFSKARTIKEMQTLLLQGQTKAAPAPDTLPN